MDVCPQCRREFQKTDIRKLHIDPPGGISDDTDITLVAPDKIEEPYEAQLRDDLTRILNEGASNESEMARTSEECQDWLRTQSNDQVCLNSFSLRLLI